MSDDEYRCIVSHYEDCLAKYGDTFRGVDFTKKENPQILYGVLLDVVKERKPDEVTLLDFGCGLSHMFEFMQQHGMDHVKYSGLDISDKFVAACRNKFPANTYYCADVLKGHADLPEFDYIVMGGVFTEKRELSFDSMWNYTQRLLPIAFSHAKRGIAFNATSKQVDWERDDLFHLPFDTLASFLVKNLSRNFVIRNDYGLYQYVTYVYK